MQKIKVVGWAILVALALVVMSIGSPCSEAGGECKSRFRCKGKTFEKTNQGEWSCPNDGPNIWCCMWSSGSPCDKEQGRCVRRDECTYKYLEKIGGAWSCPHHPPDVWCCLPHID